MFVHHQDWEGQSSAQSLPDHQRWRGRGVPEWPGSGQHLQDDHLQIPLRHAALQPLLHVCCPLRWPARIIAIKGQTVLDLRKELPGVPQPNTCGCWPATTPRRPPRSPGRWWGPSTSGSSCTWPWPATTPPTPRARTSSSTLWAAPDKLGERSPRNFLEKKIGALNETILSFKKKKKI